MNKPASKMLPAAELHALLEKACEKLIFISETDSAVEPFIDSAIDVIDTGSVARALDRKPTEAVEQLDLRTFFEKLTRPREWHNESQKRLTQRFAELEKLLEENLEDPKVFRFGTIRIDMFAVGKNSDGDLAGVKTMAVET
jgi:hypothetical protein